MSRLSILVLYLCGWLAPAQAANFDPDMTWRTLTSEHFRVHFHQGEEALADDFAESAETIYDTMTVEMKWTPRRRTEVVLVDRTDQANGYATILPRNTIVIYVTAPEGDSTLGLYEDWNSAIFTHEFAHILHMDTHRGLLRVARSVIGRIASTNQLSPLWMIEGLATFQETRHTPGGRGRTPAVDMIKRTAVLEDAFPPLGNLDGFQAAVPSGNLRYLFGQDFMQYIADRTRPEVWTDWTHAYGGRIPYLLPSKKVFGERLPALYEDWKQTLIVRYHHQTAQIAEQGIRDGVTVSESGSSCIAPRFSPDGLHILWSCMHPRKGASLWLADADGQHSRVLYKNRGADGFTWRKDSKAFVYAGTHVVNRFNTWSDVYLVQLGRGSPTALTTGARARDPDFSPDGSRLLVVTNAAQNNQLEVLTVDRRREALTQNADHTQYERPRYSPDGSKIAVSAWRDGQRDLWLLDADAHPLRQLTDDKALDVDPEWSRDGQTIYFASDRTGVPNIHAIQIETGEIKPITNVLTGAMAPSLHPDGHHLAFQGYGRDGWQIRLLNLDTASAATVAAALTRPLMSTSELATPPATDEHDLLSEMVPHAAPVSVPEFAPRWVTEALGQAPPETLGTFEQTDTGNLFGPEKAYNFRYPVRRYNPLTTVGPTHWLPYVQLSPYGSRRFGFLPAGYGWQASAATGGRDTLGQIGWGARVSYRTDADFIGGAAAVTLNRWLPVYSIGVSRNAVPFGEIPLAPTAKAIAVGHTESTGSGLRYWEDRTTAYATVSYPYTWRSTVFARYLLMRRAALDPLPDNTDLRGIPIRGTLGSIAGGWRFGWGRGTPMQISPEGARSVSFVGGVVAPWLGTRIDDGSGEPHGITQLQATADLREYVVNPWVPNHVLALHGAAGLTAGATPFMGNYQLGGYFGDAGYVVTPDEYRMLRGYPQGTDIGDLFWLASAEYRAPLWRIDRGIGSLPLFFRYLAGALFVDAGNAFTRPAAAADAIEGTRVGVGAEVTLAMIAGWQSSFRLRAGIGVGLGPEGYAIHDPRAFYVAGGSSF